MTPADHVVLIGMMGVGKSTVGRLLADRWSMPFVDTDEELECREGCSIEALFDRHDEAGFRRLEAAVVLDVLSRDVAHVIAAGGGVVTGAECRAALDRRATVVWLTAPVDVLTRRVGDGGGRPLLGASPEEALTRLLDHRIPLYEAAADEVVDTAGRTPAVVARRVAGVIG